MATLIAAVAGARAVEAEDLWRVAWGEGAAAAGRTEASAFTGLVVTFPHVSRRTVRSAMEQANAPGGLGTSQAVSTLPVEDARFSEALRYGLIPAHQNLPQEVWKRCLKETDGLNPLLRRARDKLDLMKPADAEELLQQFEAISACTRERLTPELLAEFFFVTGWYRRCMGDDAIGPFQRVVALRPDYPFPEGYPSAVPDAFRAAQSWVSSHIPGSGPVRLNGLSGLELYVDGVAVREGQTGLDEGRHFLQWVDRRGDGAGGTFESLSARDARGPIDWPGPRMQPVPSGEAITRLENAMREGSIEPGLKHALVRVARDEGHPWVLVVLPATLRAPATSLLVSRNGRCRIDPVTPGGADRGSQVAARAALGFGAATALSGGVAAGAEYLIESHQFRWAWLANTTEGANRVSPFVLGACLAGTLVSTSIYLWRPKAAVSRDWEIRLLVPIPRTSKHRTAGVQVGVRW